MRKLTNQEKKKWGYRFKKSAYKPEVLKQFLESFSQEIKWQENFDTIIKIME